jgi:peptidoglycan/xylan/chitin deacetylase (PgdA/CDA1 family)
MMKPKPREKRAGNETLSVFIMVVIVLAGSAAMMASAMPAARVTTVNNVSYPADIKKGLLMADRNVRSFEKQQQLSQSQLVSNQALTNMLSQARLDAANGDFDLARDDLKSIQTSLDNLNLELAGGSGSATAAVTAASGSVLLPILIYHYTPPDFEQQLQYLVAHNYNVIDMRQALAGLEGEPLPPKPIVITFDDGYENQMQAFELLKKYNMKATFYIINGGVESRWCIGAGRRYHDPLQPPTGCGDAYLTWSQVRTLDKSGLITIGGHTIDHENLATLSPSDQQFEIDASKAGIEAELGHPIYDFAYPYGAYNATTISLVQQAGYLTAVSTDPGDYQSLSNEYTLNRIRTVYGLP